MHIWIFGYWNISTERNSTNSLSSSSWRMWVTFLNSLKEILFSTYIQRVISCINIEAWNFTTHFLHATSKLCEFERITMTVVWNIVQFDVQWLVHEPSSKGALSWIRLMVILGFVLLVEFSNADWQTVDVPQCPKMALLRTFFARGLRDKMHVTSTYWWPWSHVYQCCLLPFVEPCTIVLGY